VIALSRYQLSLMLRSHRWIPPAVLFILGVVLLGGTSGPAVAHGAGLAPGLSWSALMLVPATAWLTRSALTAEPAAARACVAAAGGPRRAQLAALVAALLAGVVFGVAGVVWELTRIGVLRTQGTNAIRVGATLAVVGTGIGAALICLLVGSAIGALFNPPIILPPAAAMLGTTAAVVFALAWNGSPANAAVRSAGYGTKATSWPPGLPALAAVGLLAVAWTVSALVAARRSG